MSAAVPQPRLEELAAENSELRARLADAEQTLEAIRGGHIDALVIDSPEGQRIFSLAGAERPYRSLIEQMQEGAATLNNDGSIEYCNRAFAGLLKRPLETIVGGRVEQHVQPADQPSFAAMSHQSRSASTHGEIGLCTADGSVVPVYVSLTLVEDGGRQSVCMVVTDLTERKQAERISSSKEALQEADRRKDEFLATLAHELRNPLAPIRTAAQILGSPKLAPQQLQWARSVIQRQVGHMALLLDDLLDIARITRGKLELKTERVRLTEVVDSAVEAARPLLDGKHHSFTVSLPPEAVTLDADPLRLSQVLSNLLTNAAKYTDPGGHIELSGNMQGGMLCLSVRDDGIGMSAESLERIFDMFSQIEGTSTRSDGGLGIGLALVRGLVDLHRGTVEAMSDGPGKGSKFIVRLPLASSVPSAAETEAEGPPAATVGRRVLVADDNKDAADALAMLLEFAGHEVRVAHGGRAALSLAQTFRPDVAILDIGMPELSGYDVAKELRREPWGARMCLVALTGWGQDEDRQRAKNAGFDRHLTKPVDADALELLLAE
jgi:PAS domain S-box-containing protein